MSAFDAARALVVALPSPAPSVVAGFDGFVDEMISVVEERSDIFSFKPVPDIGTFGRLITAAAGQSSLREIVIHAVHPGGCAVNLGDGLASLDIPVHCFATLGEPPHPAFASTLSRFASATTWGREPGRTLAFEFGDGKVMFSAVEQLREFTPEAVRVRLADGAYLQASRSARVIALNNWTLYPNMTGVWKMLIEEVFSKLENRPAFFFDLVDPSSRSETDIRKMIDTLPLFQACGPVTLGLNGNEAEILARVTGIGSATSDILDTARLAEDLRKCIGISEVIIHRNHFAGGACDAGRATVMGPHCARPKKSTGAGDRFNAGYVLGLLGEGDLEVRLTLGCAVSGFFVREARSPTRSEIFDFLTSWEAGAV